MHVYLDHNATTPVRPEAVQAILAALQEGGNPSSVHASGRGARKRLEQARRNVAALIGGDPAGLVFTSGGTEANALALMGSGRPRILYSAIEHDSVRAVHPQAEAIPVTKEGIVDLAALAAILAADTRPAIVSLMLANNETGILQPLAEARAIAHSHGALLHCDAVQVAGKLPVDLAALGVDLMSLSGHKIGGPPGVGALYIRPGLDLAAIQRGGGQERRLRGGTENLPGIAGFGAAALAAAADIGQMQALAGWRDALEAGVLAATPQAVIVGRDMPRLPNTSCIALPGVKAETAVMTLDLAGMAVSAGSACSSGKVTASHVLAAMGLPPAIAGGAIRVSLGWTSTAPDVEAFLAAWSQTARRLRPMEVAL